ncbi:MAG: PD40 domain-containing protein, partial [Ferruginibacter sp.]|nr:PD40 domain-containing protein [Cytophagales bacterium]
MTRILTVLLLGGLLPSLAAQDVRPEFSPPEPADTVKRDTARKADRATGLPLKAERFIPIKTSEGTWMSLDLSADGQTLVFDLLGDLYSLPITGGKATRLTSGLAFDSQPRFSPDGKHIVFLSDRSGSENVWVLETGKTLVDTTTANERNGLRQISKDAQVGFASPEWTPDGQYILVSKSSGLGVNHLHMYHLEGGSGVDLFAKEKTRNAMGAAFGPDRRYVYLATQVGRWGYNLEKFKFQIATYDRETGETFPITGEVGGAVRPAVSPDGKWLVYASRYDGQTGFRLRNLQSSADQWLTYPIQRDDQESRFTMDLLPGYTFTPDSKALIASVDGKIHRIDIPTGTKTPIPFEVETTVALGPHSYFETPVEDGPVKVRQIRYATYSPDHSKLAFVALDNLYVKEMKTGKIRELAPSSAGQFAPAWSPDGNHLAYVTWSEQEGGHVHKVAVAGGKDTRLSRVSAFYNTPVWTPDGKEVVVAKGPWQQQSELSYFNFI